MSDRVVNGKTEHPFSIRNCLFLFLASVIALLARFTLGSVSTDLSKVFIWIVSGYLIILLIGCACLSSEKKFFQAFFEYLMPSRIVTLFMFTCFFIILLYSWSNVFLHYGVEFDPDIKFDKDAVYYAFLTMTTIGDGNFSATTGHVQRLLIEELVTSFLFLISIFPILISRISIFA